MARWMYASYTSVLTKWALCDFFIVSTTDSYVALFHMNFKLASAVPVVVTSTLRVYSFNTADP